MSTLEFVHIPKTGGVSIVFTYSEYQWGHLADRDKVREKIPHYDLRDCGPPCSFWHHHGLIETLYQGSHTFCVIRNPLDRILSEYRFQNLPDHVSSLNATLAQWKMDVAENPFSHDNHLTPQHLFAEKCNHVLLLDDHLEQSVQRLVEQYGITPKTLLRENVSIQQYQHITSPDIISLENREWIESYYAKDFEWYDRLRLKTF